MDTFSKFEPIFFSPKPTRLDRRLHKGGGGGDGGAAKRQAAEDARIAQAVQRVNEIFGLSEATPETVDKSKYYKNVPKNVNNPSFPFLPASLINQQSYSPNPGDLIQNIGRKNNPQFGDSLFDDAGYNAAVAAAQAKADGLKGAAQRREQLYSKIATDTSNNLLTDLIRERDVTQRELNFDLARKGLAGGSRDIDASKDVLDTFLQGKLKASNIGLQNANNARVADDNTRTDLISKIRAGLDEGNAMQQSFEGMRNNANQGADSANSQALQGFFSTIRGELDRSQYQQGLNQAQSQFAKSKPQSGVSNFNGNVKGYA